MRKEIMGKVVASAGPYANNLYINNSSVFTGRMLFLTPNQQHQSTKGIHTTAHTHTHTRLMDLFLDYQGEPVAER